MNREHLHLQHPRNELFSTLQPCLKNNKLTLNISLKQTGKKIIIQDSHFSEVLGSTQGALTKRPKNDKYEITVSKLPRSCLYHGSKQGEKIAQLLTHTESTRAHLKVQNLNLMPLNNVLSVYQDNFQAPSITISKETEQDMKIDSIMLADLHITHEQPPT